MMKYLATTVGAFLLVAAGGAYVQDATANAATPSYKPTVDDWVGVNAAVNNYTLGLERHDSTRFDKAFWPEATVIAQPEPGKSFSMPYRQMLAGPTKPPPGAPPNWIMRSFFVAAVTFSESPVYQPPAAKIFDPIGHASTICCSSPAAPTHSKMHGGADAPRSAVISASTS